MTSKPLFNFLLTSAVSAAAISFGSLIYTPEKANAAWGSIPTCPSAGNTDPHSSDCLVTPEVMEIKFYELGFCKTSDPLAGANFDRTNCEKVWESDTGATADLADFSYKGLAGSGTYKISTGTYQYAYVIIDNVLVLKGKSDFNGETYFSTSDGNFASTADDADMSSYAKYNMDVANFSGGSGCWDSPATTTTGYGTTKAYLANTNLVTASNTSECNSATRFIGSIQLETPVTVTSTTKTYGLTWSIEDKGLWVEYDGSIHPSFVGSGPFLPIFTFE
tara:strand:- start:183 stop:1013 length:831 start_codon:yes stop_codon:yes gene_type:complete